MQWLGRRGSVNVDDRRSQDGGFSGRGPRLGCGGTIGFFVLILVVWALGGNPLQLIRLMEGGDSSVNQGYTQDYVPTASEDSLAQFVSVVLADTEDVWTAIFESEGMEYRKPTLVLFTGFTSSACGTAQRATGPFYCQLDEKIYVDLSFFNEMSTRFKAGGDFAYAYVVAHEVGHHVQKLLGTLEQVNAQMSHSDQTRANELSVRLELQADFYAGVWANKTQTMFNSLDAGDIDEALNAASAIGDDRIQEQTQGYSVPDSFTHGTSQQRHDWFYKGYRTGDISQGGTFN